MPSDLQEHGQSVLLRLMTHLAVGYQDLGHAFRVSEETVRLWKLGDQTIPKDRLADVIQAGTSLERLLTIFDPERLPEILRRRADLFGGETALDWILHGRIEEVASCYEAAFAHQG